MNKDCVIGIDMGGTKISTALADLNGNVLSQCTIPTNAFEGEEAVLNRIINTIDTVISKAGKDVSKCKDNRNRFTRTFRF